MSKNQSPWNQTKRVNRGQYQGYSSLKNTSGNGKPATRCVPSMRTQTVPLYKSLGYGSLTHNDTPDGDAYFKIDKAYPKPCVDYQFRNCDGQVNENTNKDVNKDVKKVVVEGFAYYL